MCGHTNHFLSGLSSRALVGVNTVAAYMEIQYRSSLPIFILEVSFNVIKQLETRRGASNMYQTNFTASFHTGVLTGHHFL